MRGLGRQVTTQWTAAKYESARQQTPPSRLFRASRTFGPEASAAPLPTRVRIKHHVRLNFGPPPAFEQETQQNMPAGVPESLDMVGLLSY